MREPLTEADLDRIEALARQIVELHRRWSWDNNLNIERRSSAEETLALVEEVRHHREEVRRLRGLLRGLEWANAQQAALDGPDA